MVCAYPDYYDEFKCTAGSCRHSCCVGWEIDIDDESLARFSKEDGALGDELRKNISLENGAHFILDHNERCPFLDGKNLCRLITAKGEEFICEICRDHPRFRSFLPGRTEIGLGLCCEEAARIIITKKTPFRIIENGENERDEETENIVNGRRELLDIATDRSLDINGRMRKMQKLYSPVAEKTPAQWAEFFLSLERMDEAWTQPLEKLKNCEKFAVPNTVEYEQLLCYFLYRHVPECYDDFDADSKILFAILSVQILSALNESGSAEELIELARLYSAEIEYSDENPQKIYEVI